MDERSLKLRMIYQRLRLYRCFTCWPTLNLDCSLFTFVVFSSDALPCMRVLVTSVAATSRWLPAGGAAAAVSEPLRLFWGLPSPPSCYSWEAEEAAGTGSKGHFCQMLADGVLILKGDTDDIVWDKYKWILRVDRGTFYVFFLHPSSIREALK